MSTSQPAIGRPANMSTTSTVTATSSTGCGAMARCVAAAAKFAAGAAARGVAALRTASRRAGRSVLRVMIDSFLYPPRRRAGAPGATADSPPTVEPEKEIAMRPQTIIVALAAAAPALVAPAQNAPNTLTPAEKASGWQLLFDGASTDGWRGYRQDAFPAQGWSIEDGALRVHGGGGGGDIITEEMYGNFELE